MRGMIHSAYQAAPRRELPNSNLRRRGPPGQIEQDKQNSGAPKRDNSIREKFL